MSQNPESSAAAPEDPQAEHQLEADDDPRESDSTFEAAETSSSYLTSLKSSIFNYRYENGRRYHAFREGTYLVPNDDEEQNRMDLVHHIYSLVLDGKLHLAPLTEPAQRVLDLGTGTGIWAMDYADENTSAEVVGTDLSPIQPDWIPPNCVFEVDDFEDEWVFKVPFDFIHARELEGCIGDEERLFKQVFENLAPGGYFELQAQRGQFMSDDGTSEKAIHAQRWAAAILDSSESFGKPIDCAHLWKDKLSKVGFVDVCQEIRKIPIGAWPKDPKLKEIGKYQEVQSLQAIDSYTPKLFEKILGWPMDEIQVIMAQAKSELKDPSIHLYLPVYFIWGRKP
ncbi:S-adenosyl-L-methionine-dependent methyltransferase [Thelonectria olida]|uniref:S-adenosyl-L-methionine-dependent methyltransferase n=1 Tax=Thelonectria olida TaxID=1576542 RepID=A0A9P9ALG2_9HYPO|nr:S-adenosyl-L-methionine-dependent methyltransferase [Thelonectria olida]